MRASASIFLALSSLVRAFTLTGSLTVSGTGLPLVGAAVSIPQRPGLGTVLSDSLGRFALSDAVPVQVRGTSGSRLAVRFQAGSLRISGLEAGEVRVEEYGLDGRLRGRVTERVAGGDLRLPGASRGLHAVHVSQGGRSAWWLVSGLEGAAPSLVGARAGGVAARTAGADTLLVVRSGMDTVRLALAAGAGETTTRLEAPVSLRPRTRGRQRFVPGGTVLLGDEALSEAKPRIRRTVAAFWMDTLVATRAELVAQGVAQSTADSLPGDVDWCRAVRYCNARSLAEGLEPAYRLLPDSAFWNVEEGASGYRLPTEAEWEWATRAGSSASWFWGEDTTLASAGRYALYQGNTRGNPLPVGSLESNALGLYDMVGNSGQWTEDYYGAYARDEVQPRAILAAGRVERTWRGGSWFATTDGLRSGARFHAPESWRAYVGVRCVRTAEPVAAVLPWSGYPTQGGARLLPGGTFRRGDSLQDSALPLGIRPVGSLWVDTALVSQGELKALVPSVSIYAPTLPGSHDRFAAIRYCNARSLRDGLQPAYALAGDSGMWVADPSRSGWRLPTEAEWEYLARAGSASGWWWGADSSPEVTARHAWWSGNAAGGVKPPALKRANPFGLYDMAGNSWQWTDDFYAPYREDGAPGPSRLMDMGSRRPAYLQAVRGGAWYSDALRLRSGFRRAESPYSPAYVSFRCVRTANPDSLRPWKSLPVAGGMRRIPGGTVRMGDSTQAEAQPFHVRAVRSLWVDTALVSLEDFGHTSGLPGFARDSSRPVDVDWYRAVRYCNARSARDGLQPCYVLAADSVNWTADTTKDGYRLPSEAEWEYLARAGSGASWWWGSDTAANAMVPCAWWAGNTAGTNQPSGLKRANAFGLYDMVGNARQWTGDLYGAYQPDGSQPVPVQVSGQWHRVYRGGAWYSPADALRSGRREHDMGLASGYIGVRCVRRAD